MDIPARPVRPRNSESSPSQRFLGDFAPRNPSPASPTDELSEDDIFSTVDFSDDGHHHHQRSSPQPPPPRHVNHHHHHHHHYNHHYHQHSRLRNSVFSPTETFGILAVLPEHEPRSVFNHQASASAASPPATASSSRMIPAIPRRPPQDRFPIASSSSFSARHNQSAPVNVPTLSKAMTVRRRKEFVEVEEEVEEADKDLDGEEMLPPHEIVERRLSRSQSVACSLLEGAGRTLKGRDLRQVRNAVWRKTGFLD